MFEPIAITGHACVLPGANSLAALWAAVVDCRDLTTATPEGAWGSNFVRTLGARAAGEPDAAACRQGGYVAGFDALFDPAGFGIDRQRIAGFDPGLRWLLHCARAALDGARVGPQDRRRAGLVLGNLSYPSRGLADYACATWLGDSGAAAGPAENRFVSGLPPQLAARALGLGGPAFAIDAACASSLYAVKLACDLLQDRSCDIVLAGGMNAADDLFLHVGFSTLSALSPSGRSRPLTRHADGLLPAEGAALLALKRLDDALAAGDCIHAVIRGVGLSNDGRERGLLAPDGKSQIRAMRQAYDSAGVDPRSIDFVECHATGTITGDGEEARSMAAFFAGRDDLPVGALKANLGHLITASGAAAILKVLAAFESGTLPPTIDAAEPAEALAETRLRLLATAEPWRGAGPRRAGISAFGFGGNNAHLILEEPPAAAARPMAVAAAPAPLAGEIAICGLGISLAGAADLAGLMRRLRQPAGPAGDHRIEEIRLPGKGLRFPPKDLRRSLGQQTLMLEVAFQALAAAQPFDPMKAGVFIGMGCDPESARWALRWRLAELLAARGTAAGATALAAARDAAAPVLDSTAVVGTMPNIPANRLNAQFDLRAMGFSVSAEELSGVEALRLACRALARGEIEAALVGAVDLSQEPVQRRAAAALLPPEAQAAGDGAVALVVKRLEDARRAGDRILAILPADLAGGGSAAPAERRAALRRRFGHVHAAAALLELAGVVVEGMARAEIAESGLRPVLRAARPRRRVAAAAFAGGEAAALVAPAPEPQVRLLRPAGRDLLRCYSGDSRAALLQALEADEPAARADAPFRLAVTGRTPLELQERRAAAGAALARGAVPQERGVRYGEGAPLGETALVFAGANAYPGVGRELFLAFPELGDALAARFAVAEEVADALYGPDGAAFIAEPFGTLKAASLVCQAHALAADRLLGLRPQAVLGLSSGETNGVFAFGLWRDMSAMFAAIGESGLYDEHLAGRLQAARSRWGLDAAAPLRWQSWLVSAPVAEIEALLRPISRAEITIRLAPALSIVSGPEEACRAAIAAIGRQRAIEQSPTLICHSAMLEPFAASWARLHDRDTAEAPAIRFYSQAHNAAYRPTRAAIRDALLEQARRPIDFAATVERAWQDGVRIFLECGPRATLTRAIDEILAGRPHLALALDDDGRNPGRHLARIAARLFAAGAPVDLAALERQFGAASEPGRGGDLTLTLPARMPAFLPGPLLAAAPAAPRPAEETALVTRFPETARLPEPPPALHVFTRQRTAAAAEPARQEVPRLEPVRRPALAALPEPAPEPIAAAAAEQAAPLPEIIPPPYDRRQLERLAGGRISEVWGRAFQGQDGYLRQVRMPMPPLLLADRVVAIDAPPGVLGTGSIVTETDIRADSWYLDGDRMPVGLLIESGQADLLLISWMGIDAHNRDERVYRLLGCEITFHEGGMPRVGDTLRFDIRIDSHAQLGGVRMFFFGYDCRVGDRLVSSVRHGQAGFFSDAELAAAKGVNWAPPAPLSQGKLPLPASLRPSTRRAFSAAEVAAFAAGDALTCFGQGFEAAAAHQRTPKLPDGRMRLIDEVTRFEPEGGPKGLGYLEAVAEVPVDAWFYDGHFLNDPCMPGTLMADAAVQALAFLMAALGMTVKRDGWRFEPVTGEPFKFVCRGQVVPDRPHELSYEVFVTEIVEGPTPTVYATLLCTSDDLKVFHCPRFGLKLVPDWPLSTRQQWYDGAEPPRLLRADSDVRGDFAAIMACAWDRPSIPFGSHYAPFDRAGRVPRLPGPPYLFVSRIREVTGPGWTGEAGVGVVAEYEVPPDAWYFQENDRPTMPFCVLGETLLQPCGWLASYAGFALSGTAYFRNLDGSDSIQHIEVTPDIGTLTTSATLTRVVRLGALTLVFFVVECRAGDRLVATMSTSFGFFGEAELAQQAGLPAGAEARARLAEPGTGTIDLRAEPAPLFGGPLRLPGGRLRMIDEVTGFWPAAAGAPGRIRCRQEIDPHAWYFKAHFYEDPVQAGTLGLEALLQALKAYLILAGHGRDLPAARFEPIALGEPLTWKYRGQVVPRNKEVVTCLSVTVTERAGEVLAVAEGTLWVDGLPIYEVRNMAMRIAGGAAPLGHRLRRIAPDRPAWVADHCPTYTRPALPLMALAAEMMLAAGQASGQRVLALEALQTRRWVPVPEDGVRLLSEARALPEGGYGLTLTACSGAEDRPLRIARHAVATARATIGAAWPAAPAPLAPLADLSAVPDPYAAASLFHGPAFHLQRDLARSSDGASAAIEPPPATLAAEDRLVLLLDALLHGVPHDEPELWLGSAARGFVAYPEQLRSLRFYGELPESGRLRVETRRAEAAEGTLAVRTQLIGAAGVLLEMEHVERLLPKGPLGTRPASERRRFLAERRPVAGLSLATQEDGVTRLGMAEVQRSNWLPGTLESAYQAAGPLPALTAAIAAKEHLAALSGLHPADFTLGEGEARCRLLPFRRFAFASSRDRGTVAVRGGAAGPLLAGDVAAAIAGAGLARASIATACYGGLVAARLAGVAVAPEAAALLAAGRAAVLLTPALAGLDGLVAAAVLAALGGRRSALPAGAGHADDALALAALLAEAPRAGHAPLLVEGDGGDANLLLATGAAQAATLAGDRPLLQMTWRDTAAGLQLELGPVAAGQPAAAVPAGGAATALWPRALAIVSAETGFAPAVAAAPGHDRDWVSRLAGWTGEAR
jgi:acyl transferase domain-containing protein/3-hydroxymyristoyl/3-hydroxydecanoyl-(acyl carrier protein) dehydratase